MSWTLIGQGGSGGGGGSEAIPLLVSGSPFADEAALDTWSQANPLELFNNSSQYATAVITGDETYRWEGADQVYSADSWVQTSAGLTPSESEFVDSGVNMPDNEIPVMGEGATSGQLTSKGFVVDDATKKVDLNGYSLVVGTQSVEYGGALSSEVAGHTLALTDLIDNEVTHAVSQTFEDGNTSYVRVRTTQTPIPISDKTADLINPSWSDTASNDETIKQVVLDFVNPVTNFNVVVDIGSITIFERNLGSYGVGEQPVILVPPVDLRAGDVITFYLTSDDGDVTVKGNSGTGVAYHVPTIATWIDDPVSISSESSILELSDTSTGLRSGGILSQATLTTYNLTAGKGQISNKSDPDNPTVSFVEWSEMLGITPTNIATPGTYVIAMTSDGSTIIEIPVSIIDQNDYHSYILLGAVSVVSNIIIRVFDVPFNICYSGIDSFKDFFRAVIGPANADGNIFKSDELGGLGVSLIGGRIFIPASNVRNDATDPDIKPIPSQATATFTVLYRSAVNNVMAVYAQNVTSIDPTVWDDGSGTVATVGNNNWTVPVLYIAPTGDIFVTLGQEEFNTQTFANQAVYDGLSVDEFTSITSLVRRCFLVVVKGAGDLNLSTDATFHADSAFRLSGVTSSGTSGSTINIYNSDGTISDPRKVDINDANSLTMTAYDTNESSYNTSSIFLINSTLAAIGYVTGDGVGGAVDEQSIVCLDPFIRVSDDVGSIGMIYKGDYSAIGATQDRWIPDLAYIKTLIVNSGEVTYFNEASTSVSNFDRVISADDGSSTLFNYYPSGQTISDYGFRTKLDMAANGLSMHYIDGNGAGADVWDSNIGIGLNGVSVKLNSSQDYFFDSDSSQFIFRDESGVTFFGRLGYDGVNLSFTSLSNNLNISALGHDVLIQDLKYPSFDGNDGDVITTDGVGNLSLSPPTKNVFYQTITAEEDAVLNNVTEGGYQWSFGNGAVGSFGGVTVYVPNGYTCKFDAITTHHGAIVSCTFAGSINGTIMTDNLHVVVGADSGVTDLSSNPAASSIINGDHLTFNTYAVISDGAARANTMCITLKFTES